MSLILPKPELASRPLLEPPTPRLPESAFYGPAGRLALAIAPHTEASPEAIYLQLLVALGNAVGPGICLPWGRENQRANLFLNVIGKTSKARKGTAWGEVKAILGRIDELAPWLSHGIRSGLVSGEGIIHHVRDDSEEQVFNKKEKRYETVTKPGVSDKRLLAREGEFSRILNAARRDGNTLADVLRDAFDTGDLHTLAKNCGERATGAHISVIAHVTGEEFRSKLEDVEVANGFLNRFLFCFAQRTRELPKPTEIPSEKLAPEIDRLRDALRYFAERQSSVSMMPDAEAAWGEVYSELTRDEPGQLGLLTNRLETQALRLSLLLALLDQSVSILPEHVRAATEIARFSRASAAWALGTVSGDQRADKILAKLQPKGRATREEIGDAFGRNLSREQLDRALALLESQRRIERRSEAPSPKGGRPREIIILRNARENEETHFSNGKGL